ncbi:hypothetical protein ACFLZC_02145 [Patescibacteria group bacterium]
MRRMLVFLVTLLFLMIFSVESIELMGIVIILFVIFPIFTLCFITGIMLEGNWMIIFYPLSMLCLVFVDIKRLDKQKPPR